jgi:hypothetical protein
VSARLSALGVVTLSLLATASALAQPRPPGGGGQPTRSSPTQQRNVGPRSGQTSGDDQGGDDEDQRLQVLQRTEPQAQVPADPNEVTPELKVRIGSDHDGSPASPTGTVTKSYFPYYQESKGDYRLRLLPPFYLEHTRGISTGKEQGYGIPVGEDTESLYGMIYYRRRSPNVDADVLFPLAWRVRDRENNTFVLGPFAHREAPNEHDNWLAPVVFQGSRKDGGYFHTPLLLTTSHWGAEGAFTMVGPYFRDRTGTDVDWGIAPLFFRGDNGNVDGARNTYTVIPPLLFYNKEKELEETRTTIIGPVISRSTPKRGVFDVAPFFFHIWGKPETGGVRESHTTLFPLFHHGTSPDQNLFVVPGYLRRTTPSVDTMLTPLYSHSTTRNGATSLTAIGPLAPLYWSFADKDTGYRWTAFWPLFYNENGPEGFGYWNPLFAHFEKFGRSRTTWIAPTTVISSDVNGWEVDVHPITYLGRDKDSTHTVLAPVFWDFASPRGRTTITFPVYWRFADSSDGSVTQVALNTLYREKRVAGGIDWQFHLLPVFSIGDSPDGHWWNLLFGLAGYDRSGSYARIKAFWIPITVDSPSTPAPKQEARGY